ncbi:hypothetical protein Pcinc_038933 [Petrolisthes cinctipes]|uniref:Chitin-binding type-2 domain-containing protein n=1 Tax=Petrolisthes cinctipes TaxID=88211 RepID=A0AAE1BPH0_PETCI|nr:hypothetical protein Pcinc_038933 [Petrolisthes cinctipes]
MAASVTAAGGFATRILDGTSVECSLLGSNLPDPNTLPSSTSPGQAFRFWKIPSDGNEGKLFMTAIIVAIKVYLRCSVGTVWEQTCGAGTIYRPSMEFCDFAFNLGSEDCACDGSPPP